MDHLQYPLQSDVAHLEIPLICDGEAEYDGLDFETYPQRKGWTDEGKSRHWLQCSDQDLAVRVQLWLYFGLLSAFCGRVIPVTTLRQGSSIGISRVCSKNLPQILQAWASQKYSSDRKKKCRILKNAMRLIELVEDRVTSSQGPLPLVSCSVQILLQTLNSTQGLRLSKLKSRHRYQAGQRWPFKFSEGFTEGLKMPVAKAIKSRMIELGWCPAQIDDLSRKYSCTTVYYISGLHTDRGVVHTQCSTERCVAYNIDESCYVPRHSKVCDYKSCTLAELSSAAVASIIEDNWGIPLVACSLSIDGEVQMNIVRAEPGLRYVAISHVWSAGMGNQIKNGLLKCQVQHIMHCIESLRRAMSRHQIGSDFLGSEQPVLFWMDTLCIPVGHDFHASRRKAISSMAEIYSSADVVLVLDPLLQSLSFDGLEMEQALAQVLCSSWMSRCWTLSEASLSRSWHVQFQDSAVNIVGTTRASRVKATASLLIGQGKLFPSMRKALIQELQSSLMEMGEVRYQRRGRYSRSEIWNLKQLEPFQAYAFAATWNNFLGRTTSKLDDYHQIFAGMEDLRVARILDFSTEDRMKAILKCHASLPVDLLFCSCERMHDEGPLNLWAPKFPQGQRLDDEYGAMKIFTDYLVIAETETKFLRVYLCSSSVISATTFEIYLPNAGQIRAEMSASELTSADGAVACLVFPVLNESDEVGSQSINRGARFLLRKHEKGDLYLKYDGAFRVHAYATQGGSLSGANNSLPLAKQVEGLSRIFIQCDIEDWPTAPLLYDSVEGPLFTTPAPYVLFILYFSVLFSWTFAFIITMITATYFKIRRLHVFYCYLGRIPMAATEIFWYSFSVFNRIEREAWSLNASRNNSSFSSYDMINRQPSLLFGLKRSILTLVVAATFLCPGAVFRDRDPWALWCGVMLSYEFIVRSILYFGWFKLPFIPTFQLFLARAEEKMFPKLLVLMRNVREPLRASHRRTSFHEEALESFDDTWAKTWSIYMHVFRTLLCCAFRRRRVDADAEK